MCNPDWKAESKRLNDQLALANKRIAELEAGQVTPITQDPVSNVPISSNELWQLILKRFPSEKWYQNRPDIHMSDRDYTLCHWDDVAYFMATSQVNNTLYVPEDHDCDDFALALAGEFSVPKWSKLALGIIWTDTHAFNIFVSEEREVWFIEPQNDKLSQELFSGTEIMMVMI